MTKITLNQEALGDLALARHNLLRKPYQPKTKGESILIEKIKAFKSKDLYFIENDPVGIQLDDDEAAEILKNASSNMDLQTFIYDFLAELIDTLHRLNGDVGEVYDPDRLSL